MSMVFLNLSDKQQYPLFWVGLGWEGSGGTMGILRSKSRKIKEAVGITVGSVAGRLELERIRATAPPAQDTELGSNPRYDSGKGDRYKESYGSVNLPDRSGLQGTKDCDESQPSSLSSLL
eukprot:299817_1